MLNVFGLTSDTDMLQRLETGLKKLYTVGHRRNEANLTMARYNFISVQTSYPHLAERLPVINTTITRYTSVVMNFVLLYTTCEVCMDEFT